jgi:hypothetical protein
MWTYPLIPIGLIAVFVVYILYLLLFRRDRRQAKVVLFPGLFFIAIWAAIYYLWFR